MSTTSTSRLHRLVAALVLLGALSWAVPALGQDPTDGGATTTAPTTTTTAATTTTEPTTTTTAPPPTTTTTNPDDPSGGEGVSTEDVPIDPVPIPPRTADPGARATQAGRLVRQELNVAQAEAVTLGTTYEGARLQAIALEQQLDLLERDVTNLAFDDREAVRRVEAAQRLFESRAVNATVRGGLDDFRPTGAGDPNELAHANALLGSVLEADQSALQEYLYARANVDAALVATADELVEARRALAAARAQLVEARRANVSAQINLAIFSAGSEIVIHGFVFPVGTPHSFGDSFGAPRMMGTQFAHAHQGTDILAPMGTPLVACERGVVTKMGSDSLGGTKFWLKGESGTYYYYAHLSSFAEGLVNGQLVDAGQLVGYVGDTGNAKGGPPHLHFEIHPDGGAAVNPYPLLKVVDQLNREAGGQ